MSEQLLFRDRRGTNAMKWNRFDQFSSKGGDLLGLWVADMDFAAPECVRQAIVRAGEFESAQTRFNERAPIFLRPDRHERQLAAFDPVGESGIEVGLLPFQLLRDFQRLFLQTRRFKERLHVEPVARRHEIDIQIEVVLFDGVGK